MRMIYCLIASFFYVLGSHLAASEKETIVWTAGDIAPYYIKDGPYKDQGLINLILKIIFEKVPEYNHELTIMPPLRSREEQAKGKNLCRIMDGGDYDLISKISHTSRLSSIIAKFKPGIFFKQNALPKDLVDRGYIEPDELAKLNKTAGFPQAFGNLYPYLTQKPHISLATGDQLHKMLLHSRVDYIFSSVEEIYYYQTFYNFHEKFDSLFVRKIEYEMHRNMPIFAVYTRISCTKNEWGAKVVSVMDRFLKKERYSEEYKKAHLRWIPDEYKKNVREIYDIFANSIGTEQYPFPKKNK